MEVHTMSYKHTGKEGEGDQGTEWKSAQKLTKKSPLLKKKNNHLH